jgi:hypothetical protein
MGTWNEARIDPRQMREEAIAFAEYVPVRARIIAHIRRVLALLFS